MSSFNEWLSQRDETLFNELFTSRLDVPNYGSVTKTGVLEIYRSGEHNTPTARLTDGGKDVLLTGLTRGTLLQALDQIGSILSREYLQNNKINKFYDGIINLGQLENDLHDTMGDREWARGKNAFMLAVNKIAKMNGLIARPNTGGTGMSIVSPEYFEKQKMTHEPSYLDEPEYEAKAARIRGNIAAKKAAAEAMGASARLQRRPQGPGITF